VVRADGEIGSWASRRYPAMLDDALSTLSPKADQ
jgi:hypothetical protein